MRSLSKALLFLALAVAAPLQAAAQFTASGTEPSGVKWEYFYSSNYHFIFPEGLDSLARLYAASLEKYRVPNGVSSGFFANRFYKTPMPAVLHGYTGYSNGSVSWTPRNLSLYTNPEAYNPDPQNWIDQLAVHEGRHICQMQLGAATSKASFEFFNTIHGELFAGALAGIYSGPTFLEGDAVTAETALTAAGRGRTADFLQYYRVSFADSLWRDYWRWSLGSQRLYTPDHYRAGYMLHAGMINTFGRPDFTRYYYRRIMRKPLFPIRNLQKSIRETAGLKFRDAFRRIEEDFAADWAANDTLRLSLYGPFAQPSDVTKPTEYFRSCYGLAVLGDSMYAVQSGLDLVPRLVRIDGDGKVHHLRYMARSVSRLSSGVPTGLLYWTELRSDRRWEKKSSSRLCSFDPVSRKIKVLSGPDDRWYNPAASPSDTIVAVISNEKDARTRLLLVDGISGKVLESFAAPDTLQLVEPAWLDGRLYASAIGSGGFGVYAVDGWEEVLGQQTVKINRLFGHDGRLWFNSDRDGTVELHSLGPCGDLRQESSLRFGGSDWTFSGDSLLFTALEVNGKGVKSLPTSALLGTEVSPSPLPRPIPDTLSHRVDTLIANTVLDRREATKPEFPLSETRPYHKGRHLFKFHSWAPLYIDEDIVSSASLESISAQSFLGATAWFQNDLETSYGQVGLELLSGPLPVLHFQWVYSGFLPVFEFKLKVGGRMSLAQKYDIETTPSSVKMTLVQDTLSTPLVTGIFRTYIPINLSSGGWNRGIIPSLTFAVSNDFTPVVDFDGYFTQKRINPVVVRAALRTYTALSAPPSGIFPRFGIGAEIGTLDRPFHRVWQPATAFLSLYGYLPGFARTHGLRLSASFSDEYGGHFFNEHKLSASAEYALPFAPVDWSFLSPITYIRNFELHFYGSAEHSYSTSPLHLAAETDSDIYVGAGLNAYLGNLVWLPAGCRVGAKYLYNPIHPELSGFHSIFSVDY